MPTLRIRRGSPADKASIAEAAASPAFSLLNNLLAAGVAIPHDCGGKAKCGTCRVRVLSGGEGLTRPGPAELARLSAVGAGEGERLACQCHASRDVEIEIVGRV